MCTLWGVLKFPLGFCDELTRMIRRYLWGAENGKMKNALDWMG
jgi:hypothetical protein